MKLCRPIASVEIPDKESQPSALSRITHLGIGAHQDDLEFMAYHGILHCYQDADAWFGGVVATDGGGSPRTGEYASFSDEQMKEVRAQEQRTAARVGRYGVMIQTQHPSVAIKDPNDTSFQDDLVEILTATQPSVVYTHNLADKHATHVAVAIAAIGAIRRLPQELRPGKLYGGEVWRGLDWMPDEDKVALDVSGRPDLAQKLAQVFVSQISGGKQYDQAVLGRRQANATFYESHHTDTAVAIEYAMDLTPLVRDVSIDIVDYVDGYIQKLAQEVRTNLKLHLGK